jgi:mRNA interferase HigB
MTSAVVDHAAREPAAAPRRVFFEMRAFLAEMRHGIVGPTHKMPWSRFGTMLGFINMRIIALSTLKAFLNRSPAYADARDPVTAWYRQVKAADWASPSEVKQAVRSASILKDGRVVFNIAGNKYRIVVWINYPHRVVYIRFVGTHRQYDTINAQTI